MNTYDYRGISQLPNYELNVVSQHDQFKGKQFKKHHVQAIDTIGVFGDETFEVQFKNNTRQRVQVAISIDGTNVATGEIASTEPTKDMWVVEPLSTITLKAWKETEQGGAQFIFSNSQNSVAVHTHGNVSSRGIIAAAVFIEGEPIQPAVQYHYYPHYAYPCFPYWWNTYPYYRPSYYGYPYLTWNNLGGMNGSDYVYGGLTSISGSAGSFTSSGTFTGSCTLDNNTSSTISGPSFLNSDTNVAHNTNQEVSVGAGQFVEQEVKYTIGLNKPIFSESLRIKFMWWDDLVKLLDQQTEPSMQPSGFPADQARGVNLKNTPRIGKIDRQPAQQAVARF